MFQWIVDWRDGWKSLSFAEKHHVLLAIFGAVATLMLGVLGYRIAHAQFVQSQLAARDAQVREANERNRKEVEAARDFFNVREGRPGSEVRKLLEKVLERSGAPGR